MSAVKVRLPFINRVEAGRLLAEELASRKIAPPAIVLALPRGGVPLGVAVAQRLHLPLDVIVVRKIGVPWQPELAMGAIAGSARVLDEPLIRQLAVSQSEVESIVARERAEMNRREDLYRAGQPPLDLTGKTAILVDDGLATGTTMIAAIRHARAAGAAKVIAAVPVGSEQACRRMREETDELVCLATPEYFYAVGQWYDEFDQVTDAEVENLLQESRRSSPAAA
ncbi:MAG TPA: phosphoribosyltransferase [Bryobacteraceae bacterium]|nr:phosphoribosyltransferase [Bryobacteraceae bacterium]